MQELCGLGMEMLQKGLSWGIVPVECVHLVEGGWKTLIFLLSRRFVQLGLLRSEDCDLRSVLVVPLLRNVAGKEVLGMLYQQRRGLKMGVGDGVQPSSLLCIPPSSSPEMVLYCSS